MLVLGQGTSRHLAHNQHTESLKTSGKLENVRETIVPHDDGEGADLVEKRESLLPPDNALSEEEEKDRR